MTIPSMLESDGGVSSSSIKSFSSSSVICWTEPQEASSSLLSFSAGAVGASC